MTRQEILTAWDITRVDFALDMTEKEAEEAGEDYAKNGANTINCNVRFFTSRDLTRAWERGRDSVNHKRRGTPRLPLQHD
jgi:hypothetical protein